MFCPVKNCKEEATQGHHILYKRHIGGPVMYMLCEKHHDWITRRQSHAARRQHKHLTRKQRWFFWYELISGRMTEPHTTHLDIEWKERYDAQ